MWANVVRTIDSGPVGGAIASNYLGRLLNFENIICTDVGGTSFDVAIIYEGNPINRRETVIGQYRLALPSIDITSIGAGGGSIAWIEPPGLLKVGPQSAGADPGPVCYGRGGTEATASDACVLLGYLNPDNFWGGRLKLDVEGAEKALNRLASSIGLNAEEAAVGIYEIMTTAMGDLINANTVGKGFDPAEFVLFIYGGAGGLFGAEYSQEMGVRTSVVTPFPETFSAFGVGITDIKHVYEQTSPTPSVEIEVINQIFDHLDGRAVERLRRENVADEDIVLIHSMELKYRAQTFAVPVVVPSRRLTEEDRQDIVESFDNKYEALYGKGAAYKQAGRELQTLRVEAIGKLLHFPLLRYPEGDGDPGRAHKGQRKAYWKNAGGFVSTDVFDGNMLAPGDTLAGPSIVEMTGTTILVPPRLTARMGFHREIYLEEDRNDQ